LKDVNFNQRYDESSEALRKDKRLIEVPLVCPEN